MRQPSTDFLYFNPRLREGGDIWLSWISVRFRISNHASEKEATTLQDYQLTPALYFNPRLREGGDYLMHMVWLYEKISIHASEKEATLSQTTLYFLILISIHASEKEATYASGTSLFIKEDFNPRLREGGDCNIL